MQTEQDLEKLVHAHTAALLRYCTGLLGCEADAQDAVQKPSSRHGSSVALFAGRRHRQRTRVALPHRLTAPRWICCGQPAARPTTNAGTAGTGPRHQRRTAYRAGRSAATRPGSRCWSACWTAWTMPRWHASTGGPPPTCARYHRAKNSWPHD